MMKVNLAGVPHPKNGRGPDGQRMNLIYRNRSRVGRRRHRHRSG